MRLSPLYFLSIFSSWRQLLNRSNAWNDHWPIAALLDSASAAASEESSSLIRGLQHRRRTQLGCNQQQSRVSLTAVSHSVFIVDVKNTSWFYDEGKDYSIDWRQHLLLAARPWERSTPLVLWCRRPIYSKTRIEQLSVINSLSRQPVTRQRDWTIAGAHLAHRVARLAAVATGLSSKLDGNRQQACGLYAMFLHV